MRQRLLYLTAPCLSTLRACPHAIPSISDFHTLLSLYFTTYHMSTLTNEKSRKSVCSTTSEHAHVINTATADSSPSQPATRPDKRASAASIVLETLLVGGQRKTWRFEPQSSIATVRQHIWSHWPQEWPQPRPQSDSLLRVLHLGHILDDPTLTLASRGMPIGSITVVHLIIRSGLSPDTLKTQQEPPLKKSASHPAPAEQERTPGCSCVIC